MLKNNFEIITLNKKAITDFALERNLLLKKSNAEWIFFVDSDETVSPELKDEVGKVTSNAGRFNGYYVYRKNYFLGEDIGTDKILRLGKRTAGNWQRRVHEVWEIDGSVGQLENPLIHNTAKSLYGFISKIDNYSTLHAKENLKNGKSSNIIKIIFFPIFKFIQSMAMGRGFVMSMLQSFHSFLSWGKQWKLQNA